MKLEEENKRLRAALERIRDYPNGPQHHSDECELMHDEESEDGCDCGYWAVSFPMLKIEAMQALAALEAE